MPVNDNVALEHEADVMGEKAVQMRSAYDNFFESSTNNGVLQMNSIKEILKEELKNSNRKFMSDVSLKCLS